MINRILSKEIDKRLFNGKAIIILGARQVGKTSLLHSRFDGNPDVLWLEGDNLETQLLFENFTLPFAKTLIGDKKILIIDEAQNILNIGIKLKIITDQMKDIQVVAKVDIFLFCATANKILNKKNIIKVKKHNKS